MQFPYPCTRCGFCCIAETCPTGVHFFEIDKSEPCPGLFFNEKNVAECFLYTQNNESPKIAAMFGIGSGCCIKARAIRDGKEYDFSALEPRVKHGLVRVIREATT